MKENFYNLKAVSEIIGTDSQKLAGKTILWTGTSGFLGQWVIRVIKYLNEFVLEVPCKMLAYDMLIPDKEEGLEDDPYDVDSQDSNREDHEQCDYPDDDEYGNEDPYGQQNCANPYGEEDNSSQDSYDTYKRKKKKEDPYGDYSDEEMKPSALGTKKLKNSLIERILAKSKK